MKRSLLVLALCALSSAAPADTAGYSHVRIGYTAETLESDLFDTIELTGTAVDFSMAINEHWALLASHYSTDDEIRPLIFSPSQGIFLPVPIAHEFSAVGALYHRPLLERTELLAAVEAGSWRFWFLDARPFPAVNDDETGYRLSLGLRTMFFDRFEASLQLRRFQFLNPDDFFTEDTITETAVAGNYHFLEKFSLGGSFMRNDHSERFVVNAGYSF